MSYADTEALEYIQWRRQLWGMHWGACPLDYCKFMDTSKAKKKLKPSILGIAPLNMRSTCQRRFTIVEVVTDRHWLYKPGTAQVKRRP